jgi:predicted nucleic acid-binding protein
LGLDRLTLARFVFDTNIWRYSFADAAYRAEMQRRFTHRAISAVVLSELRRSARTDEALEEIEKLERLRPPYVFAPTRSDWQKAAQFLGSLLPELPRPITREVRAEVAVVQNDALIALSSWNLGYTVVTSDLGFQRISEFFPKYRGRLVICGAPAPNERDESSG